MALDFLAGCVGGCAGVLVGYPFDTIKVHLQTQNALRPVYKGTFHCMQTIVQKETVAGLYRGMSSPLGGVALINAMIFGVYGNVQRRMADPDALVTHFWAGAAAGLSQSVVCCPIELAKTRMQVQTSLNGGGGDRAASLGQARAVSSAGPGNSVRGPLQCLAQMARSEGVGGVWRGLGATAVRDSVGIAVYFASYEWLVRSMASDSDTQLPTGSILLAGGLAGTISWLSSFPIDVVKSRLQVDGLTGPRRYTGFWDCCRQSARTEGLAFLGRGLVSTLMRAFPTNAATFAAVTWVFQLAGSQGHRQEAEAGWEVSSSTPLSSTPVGTRSDAGAAPASTGASSGLCFSTPLFLDTFEPRKDNGLNERRQQLASLVVRLRSVAPEGLTACFKTNAVPTLDSDPYTDPDPTHDPAYTEAFAVPSSSLDPSVDFQKSVVAEHVAALRRRKSEEDNSLTLTSVS